MTSHRRRGNILAIVVAIMFVLVVLVMALHTSQSKAVRSVTQAEGELQFRQGFEFAVAEQLAQTEPLPPWLKVTGETEVLRESNLPLDYAKTLFTALPSLTPVEGEQPPGFQTSKLNPDTSDGALRVFAGKFQWLVAQKGAGYAAYAPKGKVTLEKASGFSNPTLDSEQQSTEAYSAVPILVFSQSDLTINDLVYGSAYSEEGDITLDGAGAIGYQGNGPLRAYDQALRNDLESLKSDMASHANGGNKTSKIKGDSLQSVKDAVDMIFSNGAPPALTLQQAMAVPIPMIPGFSQTVPGVFYEFWFHMPYPPDFASFESPGGDPEADAKEAKRLKDEIDRVKAEIADLDRRIAESDSEAERDALRDQKAFKQIELDALEDEAKDLQDKLEGIGKENEQKVGQKVGSDPPPEPVIRRDDDDIPNAGITGWSYAKVFGNFFGLLKDTLTGDFENIAERFVNKVRIVHFGDKDYEPKFEFDNGFLAKATVNVPPGRILRYDGNCEFEGDLWLQKGSLMHVGGDLRLTNPNPGSNNPFKPSGRLVMEEGSTLVVDGDLTLEGQEFLGSLWVCSEPGKIHPITTAILVDGTVTIPYGSFTSTSLEDGVKWLVEKHDGPQALHDTLSALFQDVAPNLSKIAGPFHTRQPFFASYAATFQLTIVPTPVGPIPVPSPIPLPRKNVLVPVFRGFTYAYAPALNASIGENLYTHADWWGFGQGTVPVIPKIDPTRMITALTSVNLGGLDLSDIDWEQQVKTLVDEVIEGAMKFVVEQVVKAIMAELAKAAIPGSGFAGFAIDHILTAINGKSNFLAEIQESIIDATLGPIVSRLEDWVEDLERQVEDGIAEGYLREVNGPLIYAETISVGEDSDARLMAGMLVAKSSITLGTRDFVGSLTCFEGDITARNLLYAPYFTQASLYKPKDLGSGLLGPTAWEYGKRADSQTATGIQTTVNVVRTEGWSR